MQKQTLGTQSQKKESYKNYEMEGIRSNTKKNTKKRMVGLQSRNSSRIFWFWIFIQIRNGNPGIA